MMDYNKKGGNGRRDGRRDYGTRNGSDRRQSGEGRTFGSDRPRRSFGEGGERPRRTFGEGSNLKYKMEKGCGLKNKLLYLILHYHNLELPYYI